MRNIFNDETDIGRASDLARELAFNQKEKIVFVILFSSVVGFGWDNAYGYYCGKTRTKAKEEYPISLSNKTHPDIKWYTSRKKAENAAKKIGDRCAYVVDFKVEEL